MVLTNDVLLFLGAGASDPLGVPTSEAFPMRFLEAESRFEGFWNEIAQELRRSGYRRPLDLEAVMTTLNFLGAEDPSSYLEEVSGPAPFLAVPAVLSEAIASLKQNRGDKAIDMAQALQRYVREKCENLDFNRLKDVYDPLLGAIPATETLSNPRIRFPASLHCYTTNYDLAFEAYCQKLLGIRSLNDGFREEAGIQTLTLDRVRDSGIPYRVFHLHGSVQMVRLKDGRIIKELTYSIGRNRTSGGEDIEGPAMIYPILEKQLARYPFPDFFSAFYESVRTSRMIIMVGFSFRDEPIVRILEDAGQPDQRIAIVCRSATQIVSRIQGRCRAELVPIPGHLDEPDIATKIRTTLTPVAVR